MPIREYECPEHGKFERVEIFASGNMNQQNSKCPKCGQFGKPVDFSIPAKRDPSYGIQR